MPRPVRLVSGVNVNLNDLGNVAIRLSDFPKELGGKPRLTMAIGIEKTRCGSFD